MALYLKAEGKQRAPFQKRTPPFRPASRFKPGAKLCRRRGGVSSSNSSNDVGGEVVLEPLQPIAQGELALFQSLDLQLISAAHGEQSVDRGLQIAVLEPQPLDFRPNGGLFGVA